MKNFASVSKQLFIRNYNKKPIGYFKILNEIPKEDTNYILGKGPDREERLQKLNHVLTSFVTGTQLKNTELIEENSSLKDDIINLKNVSLSYREDYARQTDKLREAENRYQKSDEQLKVFKLLFDDMAQHLLRTNELYLKVTNNFNIQGAFNHIIKYFIVSSSISEKEALKEIIQQDELLKQAIYFIYEHYQSQKKFFQLDYDKLWEKIPQLKVEGNVEEIRFDDKTFSAGERSILMGIFYRFGIPYKYQEKDGSWMTFDFFEKVMEYHKEKGETGE